MQIVIDIPEVFYEALRKTDVIISGQRSGKTLMSVIFDAVANGTPLPKGHGKLIDADMVCDELEGKSFNTSSDYHNAIDTVDDAPTIIEADKAESEE